MKARGVLAVVGAGGHGRVVADSAVAAGWSDIVFFDDRYPDSNRSEIWPIVGRVDELIGARSRFDSLIVGIGDNLVRARMSREFSDAGLPLATIIHPRAWVSPNSKMGSGCFAAAGGVVNIGTAIGDATIINTGATVDHDCEIGEGVHISPGAHLAGGVKVGDFAWIGIGASIRECISVGERSIIGAGAAVVKNVDVGQVALGCPARVRNQHA